MNKYACKHCGGKIKLQYAVTFLDYEPFDLEDGTAWMEDMEYDPFNVTIVEPKSIYCAACGAENSDTGWSLDDRGDHVQLIQPGSDE